MHERLELISTLHIQYDKNSHDQEVEFALKNDLIPKIWEIIRWMF